MNEQHAKYRVVFHINDEARAGMALRNLANLLDDAGEEHVEAAVVAHAGGVIALKRDSPHLADLERLAGRGVRFAVCENTLQSRGLSRIAFLEQAEIVSSGVTELVRLQHEGFAYIKP